MHDHTPLIADVASYTHSLSLESLQTDSKGNDDRSGLAVSKTSLWFVKLISTAASMVAVVYKLTLACHFSGIAVMLGSVLYSYYLSS